jgi:hypothetical protein
MRTGGNTYGKGEKVEARRELDSHIKYRLSDGIVNIDLFQAPNRRKKREAETCE